MRVARVQSVGILALGAALLVAAAATHFSFRAGCLFDAAQGTGDFAAASSFSIAALASGLLAISLFGAGSSLATPGTFALRATAVTLSMVVGIPVLWYTMARAEAYGLATCLPT